jgi:ABC-type uncharacterized transport system involved in gliding motility auxiliary subunit
MFARIANILGWAGVALVLAAFALWLLQPLRTGLRQGLALAGLACILVYILSQWREIADSFRGKQARYGSLSAISIVVVLAILVGINYVARRQHKRWDLTASKEYTLSDQTRRVVQDLKQPLRLIAFARELQMQPFRDRLQEYQFLSRQVQVEYIDPERQPALARKYQIQSLGTIVVEHQGRVERVTGTSEQDLTNAIVKAVQGQEKKVYFVSGHGEHDPTSADERTGYNAISEALRRDNFGVESLPLLQNLQIPADASVLVVAGPTTDFLPPEIEALKGYLAKGGKLMLLLDPTFGADAKPLPNLVALAKEWGIEVGNDVVVDTNPVGRLLGLGPDSPIAVPPYPAHPITERFRLSTAFPLVRSITPAATPPAGRSPQGFASTGPSSWAETDLAAISEQKPVGFDEASDRRGPVTVAAAVSAPVADANPAPASPPPGQDAPPRPETRIVVFGDSDFAANVAVGIEGNGDLFLNAVNWLAQQESLIAIRPRQPDDRRVTLTEAQQYWVWIFSILLLPGAVIAAGVYSWWRRRG